MGGAEMAIDKTYSVYKFLTARAPAAASNANPLGRSGRRKNNMKLRRFNLPAGETTGVRRVAWQNFKRFLIGKPIASEHHHHELIPRWKALAVLASDALSSVAYATEEILMVLVTAGTVAMGWSLPLAAAIVLLLFIVTASYRQTIDAYPSGGGAYIVARENLGTGAGLVAGAALMIDYTLTVAVSVCSGMENIASAVPFLHEHLVAAELMVIFLLTVVSLRGMNESSVVVAVPCYFFIASVFLLIGKGLFFPENAPLVQTQLAGQLPDVGLMLLLRAFSSGCAALTGVEAISNGIPVFKEPKQQNAKATLAVMVTLLGVFFLGITWLAHEQNIVPGHGQTVISLLARSILGEGTMYYMMQAGVAMILFLAASTSYADFPRLASLLAHDRYLPRQLASLGDRLVFSNGVLGLSLGAAFLVVGFGGRAHYLIPLYAVGVFLSFTLSQAGMVIHHWKLREPKWKISLAINASGMVTTAVVLMVVAVTKFANGAWMVLVLIPVFVFAFSRIHNHYIKLSEELGQIQGVEADLQSPLKQVVIVPVSGLHVGVVDAYRHALALSPNPRFVYVEIEPETSARTVEAFKKLLPHGDIVVVPSPFRSVLGPLLSYIEKARHEAGVEYVTVVIPEFVTKKWYHQFLHNQTAFLLKTALMYKKRVVVVSVRYHLKST